jgi:hypothetical protein
MQQTFAKGGHVKGDGNKTNNGKDGGFFEGRSHAQGGIKAVNVDTNQPIEVEGNEVVINKRSVSDGTLHNFNGKKMTNKQILSEINQSGGGVSFAKGGETDCGCTHIEYEDGGQLRDSKITTFASMYDGEVDAYESISQANLYYYVSEDNGHYIVLAEAVGFPSSEAYDDWFSNYEDAMQVAKDLAEDKYKHGGYMERGGLNNDSINRKTGKAIGFNVGEYYHDANGKKIRYIGNDLFMDDKRNYIKVDLDTVKLSNGGEIDWGSDLGDGFTIGTDVHITDNKSLYNGKTGYVSGVVGKNLMVTILENGNERNVVVRKKGVEKLDAPEFAQGGVISSSTTKEGIEKLIGDYYYSKNISLRKLDDKDEYEVYNSKGKINGVKVVLNKGRYQFVESNKMAQGGHMEHGGEIGGLNVYEAVYLYVKKAIVSKYREDKLKYIGLWKTQKAEDVEKSLIKKGYLNNGGAITELGKNKAREIDEKLESSLSSAIGSAGYLRNYDKLIEKYNLVGSSQMANGGYMEEGGEIKEVTDGEDTFYLTYIDPTHFYTSNSKDFIGNAHHLAEFISRPFYNEVKSWLNSYNATKVAKDTSSKKDEFENLKQKYTDERQSLDEFFTPKWVAEIMYKLAVKYGFKGGNVLEPSFGKGVFFDVLIEHGMKPNQLWGCEIYKPNFDYVERTYPSAHLIKHNFEYEFAPSEVALNRDGIFLNKEFKETTFDLVIGNPPYGSHKSPYSYFWADDLQVRYEGFFIYLALQKLKKDGLCVFIINSLWLNNGNKYNKQKEMIDKYGEMIDSYRLPNNIFKGENRDTSIATDIVIFKRK